MKYPIQYNQQIQELEQIVSGWPIDKDFDLVLKWVMQFDTDDVDIGVRIIKNMNVIGFEDLNTSLSIAHSKLERVAIDRGSRISNKNTLFAGIGEGAKSGAMIGYNFRLVNELPEENFITDESIKHLEAGHIENIVLLDDVIGTGHQAAAEIKQLTERVTPFGVKNIFLITAVGMADGIKHIIDNTKAHVFSAFEYSDLDTASNLDSSFYYDIPHERRELIKSRLEYYGKVTNKEPLGFGGVGALIAFYYNTPNISLPVIWGSKNSWIPLFKRVTRISGINSYYKQMDSAIAKKVKEQPSAESVPDEIVIVVEGRLDEMFFDFLIAQISEKLAFEKYSVISLGGFGSKKLIENIARLAPACLFVIEQDPEMPPMMLERNIKLINAYPHILVEQFEEFINIDHLMNDERWARLFSPNEDIRIKNRLLQSTPMREIRRRLITQPSVQREFFSTFLKHEKVIALQSLLIQKINSLKPLSMEAKA